MTQMIQDAYKDSDIAIIGMACRFPGANDTATFWRNLCNGFEALTAFPDDELVVSNRTLLTHPDYIKVNGILSDIECFDADFFGFHGREVETMDPQQRLLLECAWEAFENAGYNPHAYTGLVGVYAGAGPNTYLLNYVHPSRGNFPSTFLESMSDLQLMIGNDNNYMPGRISYKLSLRGPSVNVQTACSTSLSAVHMACQSLLSGECTMALAGCMSIRVPQKTGYLYQQDMVFSADGHCRAFDAQAQGTPFGNGGGVVLLKLLQDALADGDAIHAVIKGSAVNNDGAAKSGYTAPSVVGQATAIADAIALAGLTADTISYVEAHGTGTALGDPIEVAALTQAFRETTDKQGYCALGSVKTNLGHLAEAAGMAGLIKTILALQHGMLPPSLHFQKPNPHIDFATSPFYVNARLTEWQGNGLPRRAGVCSVGLGGTNAHLVLEEAPRIRSEVSQEGAGDWHLLPLSARNEATLCALAGRYADYLAEHPDTPLSDLCFTARTGRRHFARRLGFVAQTTEQLRESLRAYAQGSSKSQYDHQSLITPKAALANQNIAFLFTSYGSQYPHMGRDLYETEPVFRETLDYCDEQLRPYLGMPLLDILCPDSAEASGAHLPLYQTWYAQPALFAFEYALAQMWIAWGIKPDIVMGHSFGEYVAACVAGVFSLDDGLKLIAERGRLVRTLPPDGAMVTVLASMTQVAAILQPYAHSVSIAAINGPESVVISGIQTDVQAVCVQFEAQGIKTRQLPIDHASHSPLIEPILAEYASVLRSVTLNMPQIKLVSNVSGTLAGAEVTTPDYWCRHFRQPVQFMAGMEHLAQHQIETLIEIGPRPVLLRLGRPCLPDHEGLWLASLRDDRDPWQVLLTSLGELYTHGFDIDWQTCPHDQPGQRLHLPTYPFQRKRYWIEIPDTYAYHRSVGQTSDPTIHPLLGKRMSLAGTQDIRFEAHIQPQTPAFLQDHVVYGMVWLPMTAYLEMALAAGKHLFQSQQWSVEEVFIQQPLALNSDGVTTLQTILTPCQNDHGAQRYRFEIFSRTADDDSSTWCCHATGMVSARAPDVDLPRLLDLQAQCDEPVSAEQFYSQAYDHGLEYGPAFKGVYQCWRPADHALTRALGQLQLPDEVATTGYHFHPALLDAGFHIAVAAFLQPSNDTLAETYIAMGVDRLTLFAPLERAIWCYAALRPDSNQHVQVADLAFFTMTGEPVAYLTGLSIRRTTQMALSGSTNQDSTSLLYEIAWHPLARTVPATPASPTETALGQHWLIFADSGGIGQQIASALSARGAYPHLVMPGSTYQQLDTGDFSLDPAQPEAFQQLLQDLIAQTDAPVHGVVHLWSIGEPAVVQPVADRNNWLPGCGSALFLVQAVAQAELTPRLWLMTQGAQPVGYPVPLQIDQSPLWGLGRTIALEHADLQCVCLDLPPVWTPADLTGVVDDLWLPDAETQIAYREGGRYVARLIPLTINMTPLPDTPFQVSLDRHGQLEQLQFRAFQPHTLGADDVTIRVCATGLNFRDVLDALSLLDSVDSIDAPAGHAGYECAGVITAVGAAVTAFQVGDEVLAFAPGSLASHVTIPALFVIPRPPALTFAEAATMPVAFLTAWYGLHHCARLQPGDRVLIHAAAGGVGQAAIQLCQQMGAEVFATASPGKWDFLRAQGVQHIYNSRTTDFADMLLADTAGQGVDVVLNSLNAEFITRSFAALARGGRFIELGKRDIWSVDKVQAQRPDVTYVAFDIDEVIAGEPALVGQILTQVSTAVQNHTLRPLPHQIFALSQVVQAFRHMQQARHVGKIVLTQPSSHAEQAAVAIQPDASYLITGGLGALGLKVARWLVAQGARYLVLAGRSGATTPAAQAAVAEFAQAGVHVSVCTADVAQAADVSRMVADCQALKPLRGIVHAAGLLADGVLTQQTWSRFVQAMEPKISGAWNLHLATRHVPLDFFIAFSSDAAVLGAAGQGNYAAANAFLDALAHHRRALGLPALTINWGAWSDGGMTTALTANQQHRLATLGISSIDPDLNLRLLATLTGQSAPQVGVMAMEWHKWLQQFRATPPFLAHFVTEQTSTQRELSFLQQLDAAPIHQRRSLLVEQVRTMIGRVLGPTTAATLDLEQGFFDAGMDSLTSIELRNLLQTAFSCKLPLTLAFNYSTLASLVEYLATDVLTIGLTPAAAQEPSPDHLLRTAVEELSEEDAEALLLSELSRMQNQGQLAP